MADALQAAGNVVSGISNYEAGKYNRDVANTMATEQERAGAADETRIRENARAAIGQQLAGQGADGFQMGTGSALDAIAQSQVNAALDALNARREATTRSRAMRMQGAQAYAAGSNALFQGMLGAASSVAANSADWASARAGQSGGGAGATSAGGVSPADRRGGL